MRTRLGVAGTAILALSIVVAPDMLFAASTPSQLPPEVTVQREIDRLLFADAKGMVLYTYDRDEDTPGTSNCTLDRHCSRQWPPLLASKDSKPIGDWSIIRRQDGAQQWAYQGKPVYRYDDDLTPGVASGDNARRLWHALALPLPVPDPLMPAGFQVMKSDQGWVFADHKGRALYAPMPQEQCDASCLERWEVVSAAMLAHQVGEWKPLRGTGETPQWSFKGRPLYVVRSGQPSAAVESTALRILRVEETTR
jgi:predicted lipoprotein with Yx(FWY)xxD motif